jgi:Mn2+/Fe2+ NRAMP family transporter
MKDLGMAKKDIINAVVLILIINILIMSAAAGTVFRNKATLNSIEEMILIFAKLGTFAPTIFLFGLLAAGFSSQLPNIMMFNWLKNNYLNSNETMSTARHRIISACYSLLAYVITIQNIRPVPLMIVSQVTGCLLLPVVAGFLVYAYNKKDIMKEYVAKKRLNIVFILIMAFALFMSIKTAKGLKEYIYMNVIAQEKQVDSK